MAGAPLRCAAMLTLAGLLWLPASLTLPAQTPGLPPLQSVTAVRSLAAQASGSVPVRFEATVTYVRTGTGTLFVQDGADAITVEWPVDRMVAPGDRVLVRGRTHEDSSPAVIADSVMILGRGAVPAPAPATFNQIINPEYNSRYVSVRGIVRAGIPVRNNGVPGSLVRLQMDGGEIEVAVDTDTPDALDSLLDAEVDVTGVAVGRFVGRLEQTGARIYAASLSSVSVLARTPVNPWTLPVTPLNRILQAYHVNNLSRRIRVHGTITYYQAGSTAVLQQGDQSLLLKVSTTAPLRVGNLADATGFPDFDRRVPVLADAEIEDSGTPDPIPPRPSNWDELASQEHLFELVSIEGTVVAEMRGATQDEIVLRGQNGDLFSAVYRLPFADPERTVRTASPLKHLETGARVRATGVCFADPANPFQTRVPFEILLRSADDIAVLSSAPWETVGNLLRLLAVMGVLVLAITTWNWLLRRRVRRQTAAITAHQEVESERARRVAELERRRARILEAINSTLPLGEIVADIVAMVSFSLDGAPCWCELAEGPRQVGEPPEPSRGLRIGSHEIHSRSGQVLGTLHVASERLEGTELESEVLTSAVRMTALAIETRGLYQELVHRSEYDLLTEMRNRFALDRSLEEFIARAQGDGSVFGLIYIDLDDFKAVNDRYGHQIGDMYLQEVAQRMKRQLRAGDILGRLGGDEFVALISQASDRADFEEITGRLEHCFHAPFTLEGRVLHGRASIGFAVYPEDGSTADGLLKAADAAMYEIKHGRHSRSGGQAVGARLRWLG